MKRKKPEEEEVEEEEVGEEEEVRKGANEYELVFNVEELAVKEALRDALAINEEIPKEPQIKSQELRELIDFKQECEALFEIIGERPQEEGEDVDMLSESFTLKKAMELAKKLVGVNGKEEEVYIGGEPSPYAQTLFQKIWQKYIDCKWFFTMLKGRRPVTPRELKFAKPPEELLKAEGEKI
jgi:hypothetical protein